MKLGVFRKQGEGYIYLGILIKVLKMPYNSDCPIVYYAEPTYGVIHSTALTKVCVREITDGHET